MLELKNGRHRLTLLPETGGAIGQWQVDGCDMFFPLANPNLRAQQGVEVGAYPLVPYSNRIAHGAFSFGGEEFQLSPNMTGETHPIHGNGWENAWRVMHQGEAHAVLVFDHTPEEGEQNDPHWPFAYRAVLSYALQGDQLDVSIVVENRDSREQPVGLGFHPYVTVGEGTTLSFDAKYVWLTDEEKLPKEAKPCEGDWSFHKPKEISECSIDNGFGGFSGKAFVKHTDSLPNLTIEADPIFEHFVVFSQPKSGFVGLEPVTNMTDAINRPTVAKRGIHVLKPGQRVGGNMHFRPSDGR
ncbi:aldose 1-epimerase [Saccharibacter sp. 17.LH.SD]|uniref:aldose 1-epimerase n=1 Tax=Saccharibacter sp. 17.LH.SD TaxID=2689393 RepID=UPI00136EA139|nr:aldose 1-epimerase [Saccharibacter sp. 17.LH.SD]MXV44127.1 aldose 1-epimerase [Saccharibacter sp. 17.LH.SD]